MSANSIKRKAPRHFALVRDDKAIWHDSHRYSIAWHAGFRWDTYIARGTFSPRDAANVLALLDITPRSAFPDYVRNVAIAECRAAMAGIVRAGQSVAVSSVR